MLRCRPTEDCRRTRVEHQHPLEKGASEWTPFSGDRLGTVSPQVEVGQPLFVHQDRAMVPSGRSSLPLYPPPSPAACSCPASLTNHASAPAGGIRHESA